MEYFAVIDTETNWDNDVMSVGIIISEQNNFNEVDSSYFILQKEFQVGGMFSYRAEMDGVNPLFTSRKKAMASIKKLLKKYSVDKVFAYNASFDKNHLKELKRYSWFDIMKIAAYKQHNDKLEIFENICKTGRLKSGYGVEPMMQLLSENYQYKETHNALYDAMDELKIMKLLKKPIDYYSVAKI